MIKIVAGALMIAALSFSGAMAQAPAGFAAAEKQYDAFCQGCHGEGAGGGDRAPALVNNPVLRSMSEVQIRDLISNGTATGMPSFKLADADLRFLAVWLRSSTCPLSTPRPPGTCRQARTSFSAKANAPAVTWSRAAER